MLQIPSQWMISTGRENYSLIPIDSRLMGNAPSLNVFAYSIPMNLFRIGRVSPYNIPPHGLRDVFPQPYFTNTHWSPVHPMRFYPPQRRFSKDSLGESVVSSDGSFTGSRSSSPVSTTPVDDSDQTESTIQNAEVQNKGLKRQLNSKQSPKHNQPLVSFINSKHHTSTKRQRKQNDNKTQMIQNTIKADNGWDKLSQQIWTHYLQNKQTKDIFDQKMRLRAAVQNVLNCAFNLGCNVYIVGSSMNGFGTLTSDVDMCLVLSNTEIDQQTGAIQILKYVFKIINKCNFVSHPVLINAKVPLLRFTDSNSGLEVDLNVNNMVGIRNTHLLKCYTCLDWRIQPLVLISKKWAQQYNINNAKEKTLSSYSLVLMVIHYLQCGCVPPVIPCLQRMKPNSFLPNSDVRGLVIPNLPSFKSKNEQSLGDLFIGFLEYYSNHFNFSKEAISIRLGCKLPKHSVVSYISQKNKRGHWKYINIEEPFDHTNTACSVFEEEAFQKIITAFRTTWMKLKAQKDLKNIMNI